MDYKGKPPRARGWYPRAARESTKAQLCTPRFDDLAVRDTIAHTIECMGVYTDGSVIHYDSRSGYVCEQCEYYLNTCCSINWPSHSSPPGAH